MHHRYKLLISMCITILFCYLSKTYLNTNMYVFSAVAYFIMEITHSYNYEGRSKSFKHRIFAEGFCSNLYCTLKEKDLLMGFMSKYFKSSNYAISTGEMFTLMSTVANRKVISLVFSSTLAMCHLLRKRDIFILISVIWCILCN